MGLTLKGVHVVKKDDLMQSISTTQSHCNSVILKPVCWITKSHFVYSREYLDHDELKRDVLRMRVFYWKRGYRDAEVDTTVTPRGAHQVAVTLTVREGPPTMVQNVIVNQETQLLKEKDIAKRVVLGANSPLNLIRLDSSRVFLQHSLWDKGYADAEVDTSVVVNDSARTAIVSFTLNPKWKTTVEDIVISGNEGVSARTIKKSLTFSKGDVFRRSELLRSQRALYESNLFKRASIEPRPPIDPFTPDSAKIIVVDVTESPPREARLSAGFNTVDFFQVEGRFSHYNWGGGARHLDLQMAVGNLFRQLAERARNIQERFDRRDERPLPLFRSDLQREHRPPPAVVRIAAQRARAQPVHASPQRAGHLRRSRLWNELDLHA